MAILNIPYSDSIIYGGGSILGIVVAIGVVLHFQRRHAEFGGWGEKPLERGMGVFPYGNAQAQIERAEAGVANLQQKLDRVEQGQEAQTNEPSERQADQAAEKGAEAAAHEARAELATGAVEGRIIGIVASMKSIARSVIEFNLRKKDSLANEEYDIAIFSQIMNKIKNTVNYNIIDNRLNSYLNELWHNIIKIFTFDIGAEEKKVQFISELVEKIKKAIGVMKADLKYARRELKRIRTERRKSRKSFRAELRKLEKSIKAKLDKLKSLKRGNATPETIANLEKEINLLSKQLESARALNRQVEQTYAFMKKEVREMRRLLRYVLANEKTLASFEKQLEDRRKNIGNRVKTLEKALGLIQQVEKQFQQPNPNPHEIALVLSGHLKNYFAVYSGIIEEDIQFDNAVKSITIKNFVIARQMEAFEQLELALTKCEGGIETGIEAMTQLVGGIIGEPSKVNVANIIKTLEAARKMLNYQADVDTYIRNLTISIERNCNTLSTQINEAIEQDKQLLAQIREDESSSSSDIGSAMAAAVTRKIEVDKKYMSQADVFANDLRQRNELAQKAYQRAMQIESQAVAA